MSTSTTPTPIVLVIDLNKRPKFEKLMECIKQNNVKQIFLVDSSKEVQL